MLKKLLFDTSYGGSMKCVVSMLFLSLVQVQKHVFIQFVINLVVYVQINIVIVNEFVSRDVYFFLLNEIHVLVAVQLVLD